MELSKLIPKNEHPLERGARVLLGAGLLGAAAFGAIGAWGYLGVVPLLTGAIGSCPLYTLLGFSTCPVSSTKSTT